MRIEIKQVGGSIEILGNKKGGMCRHFLGSRWICCQGLGGPLEIRL